VGGRPETRRKSARAVSTFHVKFRFQLTRADLEPIEIFAARLSESSELRATRMRVYVRNYGEQLQLQRLQAKQKFLK